jgi:hypothetical protein
LIKIYGPNFPIGESPIIPSIRGDPGPFMGVERYTVKTLSSTIYINNKLGWISNPPNSVLLLSLPSLSVSPFFYISVEKGRHKAQWKKVSSLFVGFF